MHTGFLNKMIYLLMYHDLMMDNIDKVTDVRLKALKEIEKQGSGCQGIQ
jgi:hypothetical protein